MKRLFVLFLLFASITASAQWTKKSVKVSKELQPHYRALTFLYEQKGIDIDFYQIRYVVAVKDSTKRWVGLYKPETKTVYVNFHRFENWGDVKPFTQLILILAHEMAHSQGIGHSMKANSIMYPSILYMRQLIDDGVRITDLVQTPYTLK